MPVLGSTFINRLTDFKQFPALRIGTDVWSRHQLANDLGVVNVLAASKLSKFATEMKFKNVADMFEHTSPYTFASHHGLGETVLYLAFRVYEFKKLSVEEWYSRGQEQALVTFRSLKHRELAAERRASADDKARARRNQNITHATKIHRFSLVHRSA
jgi:hypothetical protein